MSDYQKTMTKHQFFIRIVFLFYITGALQVKAQEITPDDSFTFDLSLPNPTANLAFRNIMQGLVHASTQ